MKIKEAMKYLEYADPNIEIYILSPDRYFKLLKRSEMLQTIIKLIAPVVPQLRREIEKLSNELEVFKKDSWR